MGNHPSWVLYAHYLATLAAAAAEVTNSPCTTSPQWFIWTQGFIRFYRSSWTAKVISPRCQHTLTMHSSKPWLMLLNKVSLFLPKSSTIQKRLGQTMVAKHTTKTTGHLTTQLPSPRLTNPTTKVGEKTLSEVSMFLRENLFRIATWSEERMGLAQKSIVVSL